MQWTGVIRGGRLILATRDAFDGWIASTFRDDTKVYVSVSEDRPPRSTAQMRYYWGVVMRLSSDATGYTPEEMHEISKAKFLSRKYEVGFEDITAPESTKQLNSKQMTDYIENVRRWLSEQGIYTPNPNEEINAPD